MKQERSAASWGHLAMVVQTLIMGPGYTYGKYASMALPVEVLTWLRMLIVAGCFGLAFFATGGHRRVRLSRRFVLSVLGLALVGSIGNMYFFILGVRYTTPAQSSIIYALVPLCVLALSAWILNSERFGLGKLLAALIAIAGVVVVMLPGLQRGQGSHELLGNLITLGSVACWATFIAFSRRVFVGVNPVHSSALLSVAGLLLFTPIGLPALIQFDLGQVSAQGWQGFAYITVVNAGLSYLLIVYGMQVLRASQVAIYVNAQPIAATAFSVVLGVEPITAYLLVGGLLTLGGIYWLNRLSSREHLGH